MAQILTQAEVDALLAAVLDESAPADIITTPRHRPTTHDFLKSGANISQRLPMMEDVSNRIAKNIRKDLTQVLHKPAKSKLLSQTVTNYGDWIRTLSFPTCVGIAEIGTSKKKIAVAMETSLLFSVLESLFGNSTEPLKSFENKEFSRVEASLATKLANIFLTAINDAWQPHVQLKLNNFQLETQPHELLFCSASETVLSQSFMVSFGEAGAKLRVIYPVSTLDLIRDDIVRKSDESMGPTETFCNELFPRLSQASIELRAVLMQKQVRLKDVLDLRPGDHLGVDEWNTGSVHLEIEGSKKFEGVLDKHHGRHIVRIK